MASSMIRLLISKLLIINRVDDIHYIYKYQEALVKVQTNNYMSREFHSQLEREKISELIRKEYLNDIVKLDSFQNIICHIESTNIHELLAKRTVELVDDSYITKDGEERTLYHIESTDYKDSYLNMLLKLEGSYYWLCGHRNTISPKPGETLKEAVKRLAKESAEKAPTIYNKVDHYLCLFNEIKHVKQTYAEYRNKTLEMAKKYLGYDQHAVTIMTF